MLLEIMTLRFILLFFPLSLFAARPTGVWTSQCSPFGRHGIISTIKMNEFDYVMRSRLFETSQCIVETVNAIIETDIVLIEKSKVFFKIDQMPKIVKMAILQPQVITHYNKHKICSINDWTLGDYRSISGAKNCIGFNPPTAFKTYFDLLQVRNKMLYLSWYPSLNFNELSAERLDAIPSDSISFWKVTNSRNRVLRDIDLYDKYITKVINEYNLLKRDYSKPQDVKASLKELVRLDQDMRNYSKTPHYEFYNEMEKKTFNQLFYKKFSELDEFTTDKLKNILRSIKWPNISKYGKQADQNAWLLVQHADHDPDFQKDILQILEKLWKIGESSSQNFAYLFDRVALSYFDPSKRQLQRYGTQGMCKGKGVWEPYLMEDPDNVDVRRSEVGLESLAKYKEGFKSICLEI